MSSLERLTAMLTAPKMHLGYHELRTMLKKFKEERESKKAAGGSAAPPPSGPGGPQAGAAGEAWGCLAVRMN